MSLAAHLRAANKISAHNAFLSIAVEQGAIGLLIVIAIPIIAFRVVLRHRGPCPMKWLTVLVILPYPLSMNHWERRKHTWVLLSFAVTHCSVVAQGRTKAPVRNIVAVGTESCPVAFACERLERTVPRRAEGTDVPKYGNT